MGSNESRGSGSAPEGAATGSTAAANHNQRELLEKIAEKSARKLVAAERQQVATVENLLRDRLLRLEWKVELLERTLHGLIALLVVLVLGLLGTVCWLVGRLTAGIKVLESSSQLSAR